MQDIHWSTEDIPLLTNPTGTGGIRLELREFKKNTDLWNLYLVGLWQFQQVSEEDQLSYFQIAGIHGRPYQSWPLGDKNLESLRQQKAGFCTHSSILFLTWHRPYLALFEAILKHAIDFVAQQFTAEEGRDKYVEAAKSFRMPFWDWARPGLPVFPEEATNSDKARVIVPQSLLQEYPDLNKSADGSVEIHNPLFSYTFPSGIDTDFKIEGLKTTTRYQSIGSTAERSASEQQIDLLRMLTPYTREVNRELPVEGNLRERVLYLLKSYSVFDQVSHNQWDPKRRPRLDTDGRPSKTSGQGFGSIEDIHNALHTLVGGQGRDALNRPRTGHMSRVPISAFDPIFWLHHTNIDRLVSIWEGLHANPKDPKAWVTTKVSELGNWTTAPNAEEGLATPLAPFYKDTNSFWTSDDVRDTVKFGYAYPETKSWTFNNSDDYRKAIHEQLEALYPTGSLATMIVANNAGDPKPEKTLRTRAQKFARVTKIEEPTTAVTALSIDKSVSQLDGRSELVDALPEVEVPKVKVPEDRSLRKLVPENNYLEWLVNIKAVKHTLGGEYLVHIFLGPVPPEESTCLYAVSPNHVGTFSPLGQDTKTSCGKCKADQAGRMEITGQIPLTIALVERYFADELESLSEAHVIEYLQKTLHWEVIDGSGQRLQGHRSSVDGLLVGVVSNKVTLPGDGNEFARYSQDVTVYPEVTTKADESGGRAEGTGVTEDNKYF
ncbi:Tyrosinase [Fusarium oxysporum f. sp. cubense race 1]|uniref:tyrosinase n=1 Tax=Fusarium oxysporum f. sp. cubense (strain race 1) TaxID=1229664 RepID=N4UL14_FUSC1|nr:Tyrosinase [Fusarium oxysporum f. sp. cubense race 1]